MTVIVIGVNVRDGDVLLRTRQERHFIAEDAARHDEESTSLLRPVTVACTASLRWTVTAIPQERNL
ncbi:hypothetical protein [Brevibacterium aurantiacum]|uniref:hypothetical protein n=1 Tax=Brevibacterium aurantiacum TaxID=273384 RepID=UPI000F62FA95|nr:hypothetical protein [Brevibacterium aurantiacum]